MSLQPCAATTGGVQSRNTKDAVERELPEEHRAQEFDSDSTLKGKDDEIRFANRAEVFQHHREKRGWFRKIGRGISSVGKKVGSAIKSGGKAVGKGLKKGAEAVYKGVISKTGQTITNAVSSVSSAVGMACCPAGILPCCIATKAVGGVTSVLKVVQDRANKKATHRGRRGVFPAILYRRSADVNELLNSALRQYQGLDNDTIMDMYDYQPPRIGYNRNDDVIKSELRHLIVMRNAEELHDIGCSLRHLAAICNHHGYPLRSSFLRARTSSHYLIDVLVREVPMGDRQAFGTRSPPVCISLHSLPRCYSVLHPRPFWGVSSHRPDGIPCNDLGPRPLLEECLAPQASILTRLSQVLIRLTADTLVAFPEDFPRDDLQLASRMLSQADLDLIY